MPLDQKQIDQYRSEGWVSPIDVMSEADAAEAAALLEQAERDHPSHFHAESRNNAHLALPFLADLAQHPAILDAVRSLVGDDVTLWSSVLFIKEPHTGSFVSWHQDATYMSLEPQDFVTAWLALTPSTRESGCVSVIPRSHLNGRSDHTDRFDENNILTRGQEIDDVDPLTAVDLVLRPGQMSLHHPWAVHGSQPNRSDGRRIGIAFQSYLSADVRPVRGEHHVMHIAGNPPDGTFVLSPAPDAECSPAALAVRDRANAALADVLYDGAEIRRRL